MNAARSLVSRMTGLRGLSMSPMAGMRQLSVSRHVKTIYNVQTEAEYEERVVRSIRPTLVMWHMPGCQDCKKLSRKFETAVDLVDGLDLVRVDVTKLTLTWPWPDLPMTIAMTKGEEIGYSSYGLLNDEQVVNLVNTMLGIEKRPDLQSHLITMKACIRRDMIPLGKIAKTG